MSDRAEYADGGRHVLKLTPEVVERILEGRKDATICYDLEDLP